MVADLLLTAILPGVSGLAEDRFVNTFAIASAPSVDDVDVDPIMNLVANFYTAVATGNTVAVGTYLSANISRVASACSILAYDITGHLDGSPHGSPVDSMTFTLPASSSVTCLPAECAAVLTLEALGRSSAPVTAPDGSDPGSAIDRPMQRRTGRLYIGPLNINTLDGAAGRPELAFNTVLRNAAKKLRDDISALSGNADWGVWSRADETIRNLVAVSTDNAFDTQRRRGIAPTARVRLTV